MLVNLEIFNRKYESNSVIYSELNRNYGSCLSSLLVNPPQSQVSQDVCEVIILPLSLCVVLLRKEKERLSFLGARFQQRRDRGRINFKFKYFILAETLSLRCTYIMVNHNLVKYERVYIQPSRNINTMAYRLQSSNYV